MLDMSDLYGSRRPALLYAKASRSIVISDFIAVFLAAGAAPTVPADTPDTVLVLEAGTGWACR